MKKKDLKVLVIIGPTAIGKSGLGISLAQKISGEIISGDSMQIYKELNIGTAKITNEEMQGVKHHLIDIINKEDNYSVSQFQKQVRLLIEDIHSRGKIPIIVGGTGLYIKAALYDYDFSEEQGNKNIQLKYQDLDNIALHQYLQSIDQKTADLLHPNNRRRVLRAVEIFETTGIKKSERLEKQEHTSIYDTYYIGLTSERGVLYERINQRVDQMMDNGLYSEISNLFNTGISKEYQSMQAIGYKEWFDYFDGIINKEQVLDLIKKHSRNFAKKQMTWFRNQFEVNWYDLTNKNYEDVIDEITSDLLKKAFFSKIVVAGGCFWGVEAYYQKLKGINATRVGYAQGGVVDPIYQDVKAQTTGHSEVVELVYNPYQISLVQILEHLFRIINPTSLNQQGEDIGTSYRTGVYFTDSFDEKIIIDFIKQKQIDYKDEIVVEIEKLDIFYNAEEYHQKYLDKNPQGYCHVSFSNIKDDEKKLDI